MKLNWANFIRSVDQTDSCIFLLNSNIGRDFKSILLQYKEMDWMGSEDKIMYKP